MSDLLREAKETASSPHAEEIARKLPTGNLVGGEVAISILGDFLRTFTPDSAPTILLDGLPRNIEQAQAFEKNVRFPCVYVPAHPADARSPASLVPPSQPSRSPALPQRARRDARREPATTTLPRRVMPDTKVIWMTRCLRLSISGVATFESWR